MRAALGASRGRLARGLLSESLLLALAGGAVGLALAEAALGVLRSVAPAELPRVDEIGIDLTVLLFTILISVLSGTLFGLVAVARFGAPGAMALKEGGRSSSDSPARLRTRNALVVFQVALALTLLVGSGLMLQTFVAMRQVAPGFTSPEDIQTFRVAIPRRLIADEEQVARAHQSIAERVAQVPGVDAIGLASSITMDGEDNTNPLYVEDAPTAEGTLPPLRRHKSAGPGYFETMGNRMVAGRAITWAEVYERRPVVVVSRTIAREHWNEPSRALGKRVRGGPKCDWHEIVGVVGDARSMAQTSFAIAMLAIAAAVALLLGVVGLYAVVAYMATQRTREIAIRMALGAQIRDVRTMFLRQGLRLMATGIALGVVVALVLTCVMSALLFGIGPMDPMTYASVSAVLAAVGLLATYLPARRAYRVDPVVALHADD